MPVAGDVRLELTTHRRGVPRDSEIGPGNCLGAKAGVGVASRIGTNAIVNGAGCLGHQNHVGDHVQIGGGYATRGVRTGEGVVIGVGTKRKPCREEKRALWSMSTIAVGTALFPQKNRCFIVGRCRLAEARGTTATSRQGIGRSGSRREMTFPIRAALAPVSLQASGGS